MLNNFLYCSILALTSTSKPSRIASREVLEILGMMISKREICILSLGQCLISFRNSYIDSKLLLA